MNALPQGPLVAWYGDDFTGSSAVLEALTFAGLPSVLFLDIPTREQLELFPGSRGIGIASTARAHGPAWMDENLPPAFDWLRRLNAPVTHYKVCSTFDSAPHVGSIGRAIDIAAPRFGGDWIPLLIAVPEMRRYQCFGHFFAGSPQGVFRLDRHPVMARHPVTPMNESDVRLHLARQTQRPIGLIDIEALGGDADAALRRQIGDGAQIIAIDAMDERQLTEAGRLVWEHRGEGLFAVGSQGLEFALIAHWQEAGLVPRTGMTGGAGVAERMVAVSGSVSQVTAAQIAWAEENGFAAIAFDAASVIGDSGQAEDAACRAALAALAEGRDPLVHSARGPDDPAVARLRAAAERAGMDIETANRRIGESLGRILNRLLRETDVRRAVISGGDTSGHASQQLGLFAFTALAPTIPGAALFEAHSTDPALRGLQLALKGGQMGSHDYFGWIKRGGGTDR